MMRTPSAASTSHTTDVHHDRAPSIPQARVGAVPGGSCLELQAHLCRQPAAAAPSQHAEHTPGPPMRRPVTTHEDSCRQLEGGTAAGGAAAFNGMGVGCGAANAWDRVGVDVCLNPVNRPAHRVEVPDALGGCAVGMAADCPAFPGSRPSKRHRVG